MNSARNPSRRIVLGVALAAVALLVLPAASIAKPHKGAPVLKGLYNKRYCEILTVHQPTPPDFLVTVFNTIGLNSCPPGKWNAIDFDALKVSEGAIAVAPNGPRRWVLDSIKGAKPGAPHNLGGINMRQVATLTTTTLSPPTFSEMQVNRDTVWVYRKGRTLRELISPSGHHYVMQAYTNNVDPDLTERGLNRIDRNPLMGLPEGWKYKTHKLHRALVLKAPGVATIVRDGLKCVYQRYR